MEKCTLGSVLHSQCTKSGKSSMVIKSWSDISREDQKLIVLRCDLASDVSLETICCYHEELYLKFYTLRETACCDPLKKHKNLVKKHLRVVSSAHVEKFSDQVHLIPGKKICTNCFKKLQKNQESSSTSSDAAGSDVPALDDTSELSINVACQALEESPLNVRKRPHDRRVQYAKTKVKKILSKFQQKVAHSLSMEVQDLAEPSSSGAQSVVSCTDCDTLVSQVKEKFEDATYEEKVQLLTLLPASWTIEKTRVEMGVTEHAVKTARALKEKSGVLAKPLPRSGKLLPDAIQRHVVDFYETDEISRLFPGKKDFISIKTPDGKIQKQKRLLLGNLKNLYHVYKEKFPEDKVGFSKFCVLRPKWCITADSPGTHSVCVCTYHQNVKLMLQGVSKSMDYHDLIKKIVCSTDSVESMLERCPNCPGIKPLTDEFACSPELAQLEEICYYQWVVTDRTTMVQVMENVDDLLETLTHELDNPTAHHFISKHQQRFLQNMKQEVAQNTCIMLADFAENYHFVVQDEVQGYHWNRQQATLHPFVAYYKGSELEPTQSKSFVCISDNLEHNTTTLYAFQKKVISCLHTTLPDLQKIVYFSDGAASQYKNRKNFENVCQHKADFNVEAEWHFFATSHGKNVCDGVGGTVKRLATRASIQHVNQDPILTAEGLYQWCERNISNVTFFFVPDPDIREVENQLGARFSMAIPIRGCRDMHCFKPVDSQHMAVHRFSGHEPIKTARVLTLVA